MKTLDEITNRLRKMPYAIRLPDPLPDALHLKQLLSKRIAQLNAEQLALDIDNDEEAQLEFAANKGIISTLELHLSQLHKLISDGGADPLDPPKIKNPENAGSSGSAPRAQQDPTGSQVGPGGSDPLPTGSDPSPASSTDQSAKTDSEQCEEFFKAYEELDDDLLEVAMDLDEHIHHRSPFANLTSEQRQAILKLLKDHSADDVAEILIEPPPVGMDFQTSKTALNRFRHDLDKYEHNQRSKADEEAFQSVNTSQQTYHHATERLIKKRLFQAAANPDSDYHEIRWLIASLKMLNKQTPQDDGK